MNKIIKSILIALCILFMVRIIYQKLRNNYGPGKIIKGEKKINMNTKLDTAGYDGIMPNMYPIKKGIRATFTLLQKHGIGTNDWNNALTLIHLKDDGTVNFEEQGKNFTNYVSGAGSKFLPLYSGDWIVYEQTRGMIFYNYKNGDFQIHLVGEDLDEYIRKSRRIFEDKELYIVEIKRYGEQDEIQQIFRVYDFSNKNKVKLAEMKTENGFDQPWFVNDGKILIYSTKKKQIFVFNHMLQPAHHIVADAFNKHRKKMPNPYSFFLHPTLPFVLVSDTINWIVSWKDNELDISPISVIAEAKKNDIKMGMESLSPDGRWLIVGDYKYDPHNSFSDPKFRYWVIQISDKYPGYFAKPILLGVLPRENTEAWSLTWALNPTAFVITDDKLIYWWEIEELFSRK